MAIKSGGNGNRILIITFLATFLILTAATVIIIYLPKLQSIQHIPSSYDVKIPDWAYFVAPGYEKVVMMNFTEIFKTTGNFSVFTSEELLEVLGFSTTVTVRNCASAVVVLYPNPNPNSEELALNILKLDSPTYSALKKELEAKAIENTTYGDSVIYQVIRSTSGTPAYVTGYTSLKNGFLLYSDSAKGLSILEGALGNEAGTSRLIDEPKVKAAFYVLSPSEDLAFSYSIFPYSVSDVVATSTKVSYESNKIVTRSLYAFNTPEAAEKNLDNIKQANKNATDFQVMDNYILVVARYDKSYLMGELRSL